MAKQLIKKLNKQIKRRIKSLDNKCVKIANLGIHAALLLYNPRKEKFYVCILPREKIWGSVEEIINIILYALGVLGS